MKNTVTGSKKKSLNTTLQYGKKAELDISGNSSLMPKINPKFKITHGYNERVDNLDVLNCAIEMIGEMQSNSPQLQETNPGDKCLDEIKIQKARDLISQIILSYIKAIESGSIDKEGCEEGPVVQYSALIKIFEEQPPKAKNKIFFIDSRTCCHAVELTRKDLEGRLNDIK